MADSRHSPEFKSIMVYVVMGVCGCGKSTVGRNLAKELSVNFYDGDDFHPPENVSKMTSGKALTLEDRLPWLISISKHVRLWNSQGGAVIACSALKQIYRDLIETGGDVTFIYLKGSYSVLKSRLTSRKDHFMPATLLRSQLKTLEEPKDAITVDIDQSPDEIVESILKHIPFETCL